MSEKCENRPCFNYSMIHPRASNDGGFNPNAFAALFPGEQSTALTDCVMDVADCSTDIDRAQTPCGAATEQHYI